MELKIRDHEIMDDVEEDLFDKRDLRKKKEKKRAHKTRDMEDCTRESFKKMKDEIDELRKRETDRSKELEDLKRKIDEQGKKSEIDKEPEFALGFDRDEYLKKGFIESAKWIKETISKNMNEKMNDEMNRVRFEVLLTSKKTSTHIGIRTCARYNRGEFCPFGKWHSTHKPDTAWPHSSTGERPKTYRDHNQERDRTAEVNQQPPSIQDRLGKRNEIRIHSCTLCMETFGSAIGHSVLNCPWILKKNWK